MFKSLLFVVIGFVSCGLAAEESCDLERGKKLYNKCAICHSFDDSGQHSVGPNLYGIVGSPVAAAPDFPYTVEMSEYGGVWSIEKLDKFLLSPMTVIPGTAMAFGGIRKEDQRKDLLCYLKSS